MTTTTLDRTEGIAKLNTAIQVIRATIEESEGQFNLKMEVDIHIPVHTGSYIARPLYDGKSTNLFYNLWLHLPSKQTRLHLQKYGIRVVCLENTFVTAAR